MRILQISSARTYGGGERHVVDLCRGLQRRGHEVFAALRPTSVWQHRLSFLPTSNIFQVSIRNSFGVLSAMRIAEFARDNQIDLIHAHVARDYIPASIACMAAPNAKFVITRHVLFPLKPFNKYALKNVERAIGVSEAVGEELRRVFPSPKVAVIANGIDVKAPPEDEAEQFRKEFREAHGIPEDTFVVGTLGELKELKGQRDLVLAAPQVANAFPASRFVIVGQDHSMDKRFRRDLKRLVSVFGLDDRFLWLDWLEDTRQFYAAIDLFVSPSHTESFGLAILEAMAHGKAVVATDTEGARQLVVDKSQLVEVSDPVALAEKIAAMIKDPDRKKSLGDEARKRAAERFSFDRMIDETESLYREILGERAEKAHVME